MTSRILTAALASTLSLAPLSANPADPENLTLEQVRAAINPARSPHPRLFLTARDFENLERKINSSPRAKAYADALIVSADSLLGRTPVAYQKKGRRLLTVSRECLNRVSCLAMAFRLTGERKYADAAAANMLAAAAFPDWNPSHFLDTAEMTLGLAIGYDWLHDSLPADTLETIRAGIEKHGLEPARSESDNRWIRATNNWGQVCHGGITAGALALMEHDPDQAAYFVHRAVRNVLHSTAVYQPTGTYPEGPSYWIYGTTYNVILIACLESAAGSDFGLSSVPGFDRTAEFLNHATGPTGLMFNYADCGSSTRKLSPAVWWFARRFHRPDWLIQQQGTLQDATRATSARNLYRTLCAPLLLHWMPENTTSAPNRMALHWLGESDNSVTMHRSSWNDPRALYLGLKAGVPNAGHGHMDVGSFVFDADGVRWAADLGSNNYHLVESQGLNLWSRAQESDRWKVFRNGSSSHNILMIDGKDQRVSGKTEIVRFSKQPQFPHTVIDMSATYAGQVESAHRGAALTDKRQLVVRDRLTGVKPGAEIRWAMATRANVDITSPHAATLTRNGETLQLRVNLPQSVTLQCEDISQPRNPWDVPNKGFRLITFTTPATEETDILVTLTAGPRATPPPPAAAKPPLEWSAPLPPRH